MCETFFPAIPKIETAIAYSQLECEQVILRENTTSDIDFQSVKL